MAQPIVIQLQELASDSNHDISDLLRKALMVATKLELGEFREWIVAELNGYSGGTLEKLPAYRTIRGDLRVQNPFHGLQPFIVPQELHETVTRINVTESVASLCELVSGKTRGKIVYQFAPEQERILMSMQEGFAQLRPLRVVGANKLMAILNTVRTRILEWALSLEAEGILGDGLSFSGLNTHQSLPASRACARRVWLYSPNSLLYQKLKLFLLAGGTHLALVSAERSASTLDDQVGRWNTFGSCFCGKDRSCVDARKFHSKWAHRAFRRGAVGVAAI